MSRLHSMASRLSACWHKASSQLHCSSSVTDALGQTTYYQRRRTGEVTRVTLPDGSTEEFGYDAAGLLVEQRHGTAQARRWVRSPRGQVLDAVDPAGRHLRYRYDSHGRLVELASDDETRYRFAYDLGDRIALETRPDGLERHLRYDATGELASIEKLGVVSGETADRPRRVTRFENDKVGRLLTHLTAMRMPTERGRELGMVPSEVRFDYDQAGRLVAEHGAGGGPSTTRSTTWTTLSAWAFRMASTSIC